MSKVFEEKKLFNYNINEITRYDPIILNGISYDKQVNINVLLEVFS